MKRQRWLWIAALPVGLGVVFACWPTSAPSAASQPPAEDKSPFKFAGTASCSARSCHGALEPAKQPDRCRQDEYVHWMNDPHAEAFSVLADPRFERMFKNLYGTSEGNPAQKDPRCLACHTNPYAASADQDAPAVKDERLFGVGCESCHGNATHWLAPHTDAPLWRKKTAAEKRTLGMVDVANFADRARACAGCHVGAAGRDVNHDLIAAGHPRLNFEFGAYQANMPRHWRTKKYPEAHLWAVGQVVSAQAALDLLSHRAKDESAPWPEFAEYDCFACHSSLSQTGWRKPVDPGKRRLGSAPWGSWYFALARPLAGDLPELVDLEKIMQQRLPGRTEADKKARDLRSKLANLQFLISNGDVSSENLARERILAALKHGGEWWDGAEQLYLAVHALNQSQPDEKVAKVLAELTELRAFPEEQNGPRSFPWDRKGSFRPREFFDKLKPLQ